MNRDDDTASRQGDLGEVASRRLGKLLSAVLDDALAALEELPETSPARGHLVSAVEAARAARDLVCRRVPCPKPAPADGPCQGTLLVVDDEDTLRMLVKRGAERAGFTVYEAADGSEGVRVFGEHVDEIDCVLLDLVMPGKESADVFAEIRARRPEVPVILISGYTEEMARERFGQDGLAGYLQKPFRLQAMVDALQGLLGVS